MKPSGRLEALALEALAPFLHISLASVREAFISAQVPLPFRLNLSRECGEIRSLGFPTIEVVQQDGRLITPWQVLHADAIHEHHASFGRGAKGYPGHSCLQPRGRRTLLNFGGINNVRRPCVGW